MKKQKGFVKIVLIILGIVVIALFVYTRIIYPRMNRHFSLFSGFEKSESDSTLSKLVDALNKKEDNLWEIISTFKFTK